MIKSAQNKPVSELLSVDATRFILCRVEKANQTRETLTDLWERDERGDFVWTVEHIFPQGPKIPQCWVEMIAGGDEEKAREYRERYVHQLGNKSFEEKGDRKDSRGRFVGYRNGLFLNEELCNAISWTVANILARTRSLTDTAIRLFSLD